jgi:sugar phosphate isomerase/epimerase
MNMDTRRYTRRDILRIIGTGAATTIALPVLSFSSEKTKAAKIGFQLYSIRRAIEKDFDGSIRKVAEMGYLGVETYPLPATITVDHAAKVFHENGLTVFSMHTELPNNDNLETIAKIADVYRCPNVVYSGWPKNLSTQGPDFLKQASKIFDTVEKVKRQAVLYNEVGALVEKLGLHFGLHNHWWEFEKLDGFYPFYYFLQHLDSKIFFEIDTYWAKTAGQDPAKVVADFGSRASFLHIKDGHGKKDKGMYSFTSAGKGALDFPSIVKAGKENIQWMIVEFDEYAGDIFEGLQGSFTFLTKNNLARGKV